MLIPVLCFEDFALSTQSRSLLLSESWATLHCSGPTQYYHHWDRVKEKQPASVHPGRRRGGSLKQSYSGGFRSSSASNKRLKQDTW